MKVWRAKILNISTLEQNNCCFTQNYSILQIIIIIIIIIIITTNTLYYYYKNMTPAHSLLGLESTPWVKKRKVKRCNKTFKQR